MCGDMGTNDVLQWSASWGQDNLQRALERVSLTRSGELQRQQEASKREAILPIDPLGGGGPSRVRMVLDYNNKEGDRLLRVKLNIYFSNCGRKGDFSPLNYFSGR